MGTFCFDQYDHPLLWCEEKKREVERRNADESIREWNRKKAEENAQKERDKREYYELSATHCPWGRPGGGAPNLDIRKRNITAEGLHPTNGYMKRGSSLPPCHINTGHIRSAADRLYITLKDHPSMSFRKKGPVDIELHYKTDRATNKKSKMQLEKITVLEKQPKLMEKKRSAEVDHCPWGKPGPGGAPWRNPKSVGSSFMRSLGWTNKELLKELDQDNPQTAPSEKPVKSKEKSPKQPVYKCCPMCTCKCVTGTALTTSESEPVNTAEKSAKGPNGKVPDSTKPTKNGSPGKSALDQKLKGVRVKRSSRATAGNGGGGAGGSSCHRKPNGLCPVAAAASEGVELVPLLARRRGIHRPVSLSSTDVTKRVDCNRSTNTYNIEYLKELKREIAQHVHRLKLAKEQEVEMCNRHFRTFEEFWGRPGHGAPRDIKIKLNLDDLLYGGSE